MYDEEKGRAGLLGGEERGGRGFLHQRKAVN